MSNFTDDLMKQLRFVSEAGNAFMMQKKQKLTGQERVLAILAMEDGMTQSFLAEVLDLRPSSLAELLKKMENSKDVRRVEDEADKRIKRIYLTEQGRSKAAQKAALKTEDHSEAFFAGLSEMEQRQFSDQLEKISAGWEGEFREQAKRFADPMDRFREMQELRESFVERFGNDWQNLSREEMKQLRREMHEKMKEMNFDGGRRMPGFPPHFGRGGFGKGFPGGFGGRADFFSEESDNKKS